MTDPQYSHKKAKMLTITKYNAKCPSLYKHLQGLAKQPQLLRLELTYALQQVNPKHWPAAYRALQLALRHIKANLSHGNLAQYLDAKYTRRTLPSSQFHTADLKSFPSALTIRVANALIVVTGLHVYD